jgi:hydroxypyruvate isomerase
MTKVKQSAAAWCFIRNGTTPDQFIRGAAEIGLSAVEMIDQKYWSLARSLGLQIAIIYRSGLRSGQPVHSIGLNRRENHGWLGQELIEYIELAAANDIPSVICFAGNRYNDISDAEGIDITVEGLSRIIGVAEEKGVNLCLELLNSKIDCPGYQCDHVAWGIAVCERVNSPRMKLLFDIYHMQIMEGDLIRNIKENIQYIGHFHIAGNPGRRDMNETQEINCRAVIQAIAETGYNLYVGHEFIAKGNPIEGLRAAFHRCDVG